MIDFEALLNNAERRLLIEGGDEVLFPVRRRSGISDFYERLEFDLRSQPLFSIAEYRTVKEGFVKVSRPSVLRVNRSLLFRARPHLKGLEREIASWRSSFEPGIIESILSTSYSDCVRDPELTRSCLEVFAYLKSHREQIRGLMARQIQHANSTKLIGREPLLLRIFSLWRGESTSWPVFFRYFGIASRAVEFRFYAPECFYSGMKLEDLHSLLSSEWCTRYNFKCLGGTLIVENLETFLSEASRSSGYLIVWGGGWRAASLRNLHEVLPRLLRYWGDMDKEGYEIYGYLKDLIPEIQSCLMNHTTLSRNRSLAVKKTPFYGPFRSAGELQSEYQEVCQNGLCIEQEKIHEIPY